MKIINLQYYTTIDKSGLKFIATENKEKSYSLSELNDLGFKFVMAFSLKHGETDWPVVISIFEHIELKTCHK